MSTINFRAQVYAIVLLLMTWCGWANADPIKLQPIQVTASSTYAGSSPAFATDGNASTIWSSGAGPSQWIQLDLGQTVAIRKLRLRVAQTPAGATTHVVTVGQDPNNLRPLTTFSGSTSDGQWLEYSLGATNGGNTRYVRITTTQSPSWVAWKEIEIYSGVEFFSYFADGFPWVGSTNPGEYAPETTAAGANLVWIGGGDKTRLASKLTQANSLGAKAVVVLSDYLFTTTGLRSDWQTQWASVAAVVRAAPANVVAAFYPQDEPYLNGLHRQDLNLVAARIRQDFPGVPIAVIMSVPELQTYTAADFAMYDWLGFDCYGPWASCGGSGGMPALIAVLRSWLTPSQRLIAVPWASRADASTTISNQDQVVQVISQWHREILGNASYVAVAAFLWQTGVVDRSGTTTVGTRDLPQVKERLYQLTRSLLRPTDAARYAVDYSASSTYQTSLPFFAFNRNSTDTWGSGGFPTAWIEANLGGSTRVTGVDLTVSQSPSGATTHFLDGFTTAGVWTRLTTLQSTTTEGQHLTWTGTADITKLRVTTSASPSWVGWHEIKMTR